MDFECDLSCDLDDEVSWRGLCRTWDLSRFNQFGWHFWGEKHLGSQYIATVSSQAEKNKLAGLGSSPPFSRPEYQKGRFLGFVPLHLEFTKSLAKTIHEIQNTVSKPISFKENSLRLNKPVCFNKVLFCQKCSFISTYSQHYKQDNEHNHSLQYLDVFIT